MVIWLTFLLPLLLTVASNALDNNRHFRHVLNPTRGPQRLIGNWTANSLLSCVSLCLGRYPVDCWTVMYNRQTLKCTPGGHLENNQPPRKEEGKLYVGSSYHPSFTVYLVDDVPVPIHYMIERKNYADAQMYCKSLGAHLFVSKTLQKFNVLSSIVTSTSWIGLSDKITEERFMWITDGLEIDPGLKTSIFKPSAVSTGGDDDDDDDDESDEGGGGDDSVDCVIVSASDNWKASENYCTSLQPFVCEKSPE